ncbi:MAG TPA: hypothetical protein VGV09_00330 [Steroidobacteraceae bacterium]|nr:hypothetical protein [Steroidobacteraceae bacterium]
MVTAMLRHAALAGAVGSILCAPSFADSPCSGVALSEVRSLTLLAPTLRQVLPKNTDGLDGIADRGADFNSGDALVANLPRQRFGIAAVSATCAIIAVEHGGIAFHTTMTEYHFTLAGWRPVAHSMTFASPNSMQDLLRRYAAAPQCPQTAAGTGRTCID